MNKDLYVNEYKIIRNDAATLLFISTNVNEELTKPVILSFKNIPFKINLEDNGHLEVLKKLDSIILIVVNQNGESEDFLELDIKEVI